MVEVTDGGGLARRLLSTWARMRRLPGGGRLFGAAIGLRVPYAGTLAPRVEALSPGRAVVSLRDRPAVRNHIGCVHAMALGNLGEFTCGLAMLSALPDDRRGIPIRLEIDYLKKARGRITATCEAPEAARTVAAGELEVPVILHDAAQEPVARLVVVWRIGPRG